MSDSSRRAALRAQQAAQATAARTRKMIGLGAGLIAVVLAVVLIVVIVSSMGTGTGAGPGAGAQVKPPHATANGNGITVSADKAKAGAPDVQIFADYQCPGCGQVDVFFGPKLKELADSGDIKLTFRMRTFLDSNLKNTSSADALRASSCADTVDAFTPYHLAVFAAQPKEGVGYTTAQLRTDFAAKAGITGDNLTKFQACYDNKSTADFVKAMGEMNDKFVTEQAKANQNDVVGKLWASTPTISVNGKRLDNSTLSGGDPNSIATAITAAAG